MSIKSNLIKIVDARCGQVKTSWAIQTNEKNLKINQYIFYVTPYLTRSERIVKATGGDFKQPNNKNQYGSKLESLKWLITRSENIVCTHELFKLFVIYEILDLIKEMNYILILDEVMNVLNP